IMGLVFQKNIIKNAGNPSLLVRDIMQRDFKTIDESTEIVKVLELIGKEKHSFIPVTSGNKLLGAIDMVNISEFILLKTSSV
ncbi:MAG: CBS domain-containing protein, partial [Flavobacteriales bacterium]